MKSCIEIRKYHNADCDIISKLFYETVHTVNACDYTDKQLFAWVNDANGLKLRRNDLLRQNTLIAEINGVIVGFGSIDNSGCLDLLFVHKDYQRQGVASALCNELEKEFTALKTYASITARPFFEKRGYKVVKEQVVERNGVELRRFEMRKISKSKG